MIIKKITLENIRSYTSQEIEFPKNSILLSGDIGSGKTSILLAIEFALFGLQPGQRGSSLLRSGENRGKVTLNFEVEDKEIIVERTLKRKTKTITQDSSAITINGKKEETSITELKSKILKLINYPPEFIKRTNLLFRYTVYSPQEEMKQIIIEDAESRLNILRHIFGVDKYKKIKENIQLIGIRLREEIRFLQSQTRDLEELKSDLNKNQEREKLMDSNIIKKNKELLEKISQRKLIESEMQEIKARLDEKINLEKEAEKTSIMLSNKTLTLSELNKERSEFSTKLAIKKDKFEEKELISTINKISSTKERLKKLNTAYIDVQSRINSLNLKKQEDLEKKNRIFKIDLCPTCLQNVSETHKHNILNETETFLIKSEKEKNILEKKLSEINSITSREETNLSNLENKKSELEILKIKESESLNLKNEIESIDKSITSLKKDIKFLESHLDLLKNSIFKLSNSESIHKTKESELREAFNQEKIVEINIAEFRKEKEMLNVQISLIQDKITKKEKTLKELGSLIKIEKWLSNDFSNLITFTEKNIMFKLRMEFSELFNKWFEILTSDNFSVNLDENFTPVIRQGEHELDYSFLSGGERTAVALAYRLALNQIISSVFSKIKTKGLVILDEPTDGFSEQQLDKVREVLQELNMAQLILVSHEQKIESFVDHIIKIKKGKGISQLTKPKYL